MGAVAVGLPFSLPGAKKGGIDRCMPRSGFLLTHLPTFSCFLLLFSPVPLEKDGPCVFKLCNKANSSQDQARFLLHRPRSGQEPSSVQMSWWIYLPGWVVLLSWCLRTFFTFPTDFCRGI